MYLLSVLAVLVVISSIPIVLSDSMRGDFTIPNWVKNTAGWWADDKIPDASFIETIEFLIKEEIITVQIPAVDSVVEEIPGWIKNTAGWWAEDKIHDTTFVAAVRYLVSQGIVYVEREQVEEPVEEVEEITDFYMEVNGGSCCLNWAYVGDEYKFQIETYDEQHGKYIDGVEISAKIISKGGELRHDFGEVTTEDGIYNNSIIIPSMDWYAENILSVTGEYFGVEKTIEKEFEVFSGRSVAGSGSGNSGLKMFILGNQSDEVNEYTLSVPFDVSSASFVDSFSIASEDDKPSGMAFSKSGLKMFILGNQGDDVNEYTLSVPFDVSSASFVDSFSVASEESSPSGIAFSKSGEKMFIVGANGDDVIEYTLTTAWDVSTASFVDSFSVKSEDAGPNGIAFSKSGKKMFIAGNITDSILEYKLTTAWDVSSPSFVDSFSVASDDTAPNGMFL